MTTEANIGFTTMLHTDYGSGFVIMAEVTNLTPPAMARDSVDVTHMQSPNGWREKIPGLKDAGEIGLELNFVPGGATFASLMAEMALDGPDAVLPRRITFPDGSTFSCNGFLTGNEPDTPIDDKMALAVTLTVSGEPVLVQA